MKVKNIVFSGFAAAILSGTAANAAYNIASQAYVDSKVSTLASNAVATAQSAAEAAQGDIGDMDGLSDGFEFESNEDPTVVGALNQLDDRVEGLETTVGDNSSGLVADVAQLKVEVEGNNDDVDGLLTDVSGLSTAVGALETKVGSGNLSGFDNNITNVVAAVNSLKSEMGSVASSGTVSGLSAALDGYSGQGAVKTAVDAKQNILVAGANGNISASNGVSVTATGDGNVAIEGTAASSSAAGVMKLYSTTGNATDGAVDQATFTALNNTVNAQNTGLVAKVSALETKTADLVAADVTALNAILDGYATCVATALQNRPAGDNTPANCALSGDGTHIGWVPVTFPTVE